jgi:cardiolipin synthase
MAGCATLPDTEVVKERRAAQAARFENAVGQLSAKRSDALVAKLTSGDVDMLDEASWARASRRQSARGG